MDELRSRETRARAELALVRLLHELPDDNAFLVVLGGLVPETLTYDDSSTPEHLGTTDVDISCSSRTSTQTPSLARSSERWSASPSRQTQRRTAGDGAARSTARP